MVIGIGQLGPLPLAGNFLVNSLFLLQRRYSQYRYWRRSLLSFSYYIYRTCSLGSFLRCKYFCNVVLMKNIVGRWGWGTFFRVLRSGAAGVRGKCFGGW